jgi:hypothetical protein
LLLSGCADLQPIAADVCGNRLVEPQAHEECDGGPGCGAPDTPGACRFGCADGSPCPESYTCGTDGICRKPSGAFELVPLEYDFTRELVAADADGDGDTDLVRVGAERTDLELFGPGPSIEAIASIGYVPSGQSPPVLEDLDGDGLRDLALSVGDPNAGATGLGVYRLQPDGSFDTTIYASLPVPGTTMYTVAANVFPPYSDEEALAFVDGQLFGVDRFISPVPIAQSTGVEASKIDGLAAGRFVTGSACDRVAVAEGGSGVVHLVNPCVEQDGFAQWRVAGEFPPDVTEVTLPGAVTVRQVEGDEGVTGVRRSIFAVDWNADDLLDLVVAPQPLTSPPNTVYVALGVGDGTFLDASDGTPGQAGPVDLGPTYAPELDLCIGGGAMPQGGESEAACAGADPFVHGFVDFNGDGMLDLVREDGIYIAGSLALATCTCRWIGVQIADFDGNGRFDLAGQRIGSGIEHLSGAGNGTFTRSVVPTLGQVLVTNAGDYDGDLAKDIAFIETATAGDATATQLAIAFGRGSGGPPEPPVTVGSIPSMVHLGSVLLSGADAATDLAVIARASESQLAFAIVQGTSSRELTSPFFFTVDQEQGPPVGTVIDTLVSGTFDGAEGPSFAVLTGDYQQFGPHRNWHVTFGEGAQITEQSGAHTQAGAYYGCDFCGAAAVDLDGDGTDELFTAGLDYWSLDTTGSVVRSHGVGDQGFLASEDAVAIDPIYVAGTLIGPVPLPTRPVVVDLDGDGLRDILMVGIDVDTAMPDASNVPVLLVFWNEGDGAIRAPEMVPMTHFVLAVAPIEIDGDPLPEIALLTEDALGILQTDASRTLTEVADADEPAIANGPLSLSYLLAAGDFDGDGVGDLMTAGEGTRSLLRGIPVQP